MILYIPQNIDPFNTHLKNLVEAYREAGVTVVVGYSSFEDEQFIPDVFHVHFLEGLLKHIDYNIDRLFAKFDLFKRNRVTFIYTAHDTKPHGAVTAIDFSSVFQRYLTYVDIIVHHGKASIDILKQAYPVLQNKRHIVCHHGDYLKDMSSFSETQSAARKKLGLPLHRKIVFVFGQLQYKNTSFAEEVFAKVYKKEKNAVLLFAGVSPIFPYNKLNKVYYAINNTIFNRFRRKILKIHKRFSQYETYLLFIAADVVFLPHKWGLTSGLIAMSATLCRPFVYPQIGVFEEQAEHCFAEKYTCNDPSEASESICKILSSKDKSFSNEQWLANNNWQLHVQKVLRALAMPNEYSLK